MTSSYHKKMEEQRLLIWLWLKTNCIVTSTFGSKAKNEYIGLIEKDEGTFESSMVQRPLALVYRGDEIVIIIIIIIEVYARLKLCLSVV